MSTQFDPMPVLLDKNIARLAITGLFMTGKRPLTLMEQGALGFLRVGEQRHTHLYIPYTGASILARMTYLSVVQALLASTETLLPGPYTRRWARRVRETTGLTREDVMIVALGSFGTNRAGNILGVPLVVTYDMPMINAYRNHRNDLQRRLVAMTNQLPRPFYDASLPRLATPDEMLAEWYDFYS